MAINSVEEAIAFIEALRNLQASRRISMVHYR